MEFDWLAPQPNPEQLPEPYIEHDTMSPIRRLPERTAAQIAAGEVIVRPASVVKELVENALDAGAHHIRVDIQRGGLGVIRVNDDGHGIAARDLWLACQRHATSKLPHDDLRRVRTLGFRGEALPSIASVADLTLTSATDDEGVGQRLTLRQGRTIVDEPAPRGLGTTVTVEHLFERLPARLATARTRTENNLIGQLVRRLALAATSVRMALYIEDRLALQTSGSGDLITAMTEVYGEAIASSLIALEPREIAGAHVGGVVSGPEVNRPSRAQVVLLVNGRAVSPRGLQANIESAYRGLMPRGRHPLVTLVIETAPDRVDINIHPAKLDVRLRDERAIGTALGESLRDALGRRPLPLREPLEFGRALIDPLAGIREEPAVWDAPERPIITPNLPPLTLIGQVHGRLLLLEGERGLYLLDQHRAHERIIYERLHQSRAVRGQEHQALPEPLLIELRPALAQRFARRIDEFAALGFQCEEFGGRAFLLRAAPVLPGVFQTLNGRESGHDEPIGEAGEVVSTMLSLLGEDDGEAEDWQERLLVQLSCRTALRRGRPLDRPTMRALVEALGQTATPAVCPHGSPLLMHLSDTTLERQFDW